MRGSPTDLDKVLNAEIPSDNKVNFVKVLVFPVVTHGCKMSNEEKWMLLNYSAEGKTLRIFSTSRTINHSVLEEKTPISSLEALILKLKVEYFGHKTLTQESLEKMLMLGEIEGNKKVTYWYIGQGK